MPPWIGARKFLLPDDANPIVVWDYSTGSFPFFASETRAGSAAYLDGANIIQTAGANSPRVDFIGPGWLLESARQNFIIQSAFASGWTKDTAGDTFTANAATSPAGTTTAVSFIPSTSNVKHDVFTTSGMTLTATAHTWSVFAKGSGYNFAQITAKVGTANRRYAAVFNLTTGASTQTTTLNSPTGTAVLTSVSIGNGWWHIAITADGIADASQGFMVIAPSSTGTPTQDAVLNPVFAGDGTSGVLFWGAEIKPGSYRDSYVATAGASVTRAAGSAVASPIFANNPAIIQYRPVATGVRARKVVNPFSGISSEADVWIEAIAIYAPGTSSAYLNSRLTVDGPF
jgi:hypothetical protein